MSIKELAQYEATNENVELLKNEWSNLRSQIRASITNKKLLMKGDNKDTYKVAIENHKQIIKNIKIVRPLYKKLRDELLASNDK